MKQGSVIETTQLSLRMKLALASLFGNKQKLLKEATDIGEEN